MSIKISRFKYNFKAAYLNISTSAQDFYADNIINKAALNRVITLNNSLSLSNSWNMFFKHSDMFNLIDNLNFYIIIYIYVMCK